MRSGISVAAIVLLACAALGVYFAPDLNRLWPFSGNASLASAEQKEADARKEFAFTSLTERLPKGKPITPPKALNAESKKRWEILEHNLARY
jgi:hypothetical protein